MTEPTEPTEEVKEILKLTPFQIKQKEYLLREYPKLDDFMIDTIVRLTEEQRDDIVDKIKSGELKHEESKDPKEYIIQSVKVSDN